MERKQLKSILLKKGISKNQVEKILDMNINEKFSKAIIHNNLDIWQISALSRLYEKNIKVLKTIDYRLLNKKYFEVFDDDKINLIACYPDLQKKLLSLDEFTEKIFFNCIQNYLGFDSQSEWIGATINILSSILSGQYNKLFEDMKNGLDENKFDWKQLAKILQYENFYRIKNIDELNNFESFIQNKCDQIVKDTKKINKVKSCILLKAFGHDFEYAKHIINRFGEEVEKIKNEEIKDYIFYLKEIVENENDIEFLKEIYENVQRTQLVDKTLKEMTIKEAFSQMYTENLWNIREARSLREVGLECDKDISDLNVYYAGTEFKMLVTSVGAYTKEHVKNYEKSWNRKTLASQHMCTSLIRNDMIGISNMKSVVYGFESMDSDSLLLSGIHDLRSNHKKFETYPYIKNRKYEKYYTEDTLINKTSKNDNNVFYNELDYRRIQKGVKKQPDYLLTFIKDGKYINLELTLKAYYNWNEQLPIVVMDIDRCLEAEKEKIFDKLNDYKVSKDLSIKQEILQKVENNRKTSEDFCPEIEKLIKQIDEDIFYGVQSQEIEEIYENIYENQSGRISEITQILANEITYNREEVREEENER